MGTGKKYTGRKVWSLYDLKNDPGETTDVKEERPAEFARLKRALAEHKAAVRALDWRSDSKLLASVGEDGRVIWWDIEDGWPAINKANAHPPQRPASPERRASKIKRSKRATV